MNLLDIFESVNEGWSDAIVAQRTGKPRTPYSVYIKGKKWKDFENDDHAEAVANKLRAKFKADGRDPSVITIAPTDYDKGVVHEQNDNSHDLRDHVLTVLDTIYKGAVAGEDMIDDIADELNDYFDQVQQSNDPTLQKAYSFMVQQGQEAEDNPRLMARIAQKAIGMLSQQGVSEAEGRVDPILIKALNNMPDGLATHGEVLNACYDAYAMELGKMEMKSQYGVTRAYIPQLMDLYKEKHGLTFNEEYTPAPVKPPRSPRGFNKQGTGLGNKLADLNRKEWEEKKKKEQGVNEADRDVEKTIRSVMSQVFVDGGGGNLSYMIELKAPTMTALRNKYHDDIDALLTQASPKELAQAAKELSNAFGQGVTEVAPPGDKAERMVKHIKKSLSKDGHLSDKDKAIAYATTWKAHNDGKVEEAQTDYQKRRQRERDIDAGKPVSRQPKNPQTDYAKKRAQDKRDMELGEGEREPYQQAIDQLTARRIDDLNMKLDDLVQRAKAEKNPEVKAALAKEFRKHKAERDSYFGINPATGMNASGTLGTVKGALDEQDAPIKHRVAVTVTDPKHPDMDVMQRTCRVTGPDREKAINSAIAHYRREGFKVHDHHYIGVVDEGSMSDAAHNSEGPKFGGYWKGTNPNPPKPGQGFGGCEESMEESMGPLGKITKHMAKSSWATSPSTKYELRKRRNPEQMAKRNGIAPVAEAKGLSKQVKIVQGSDAGKIGRIREIKLGAYKGAPKTYYIDLDDGGQANNLPGTALRLVKSEMTESLKKGEYYVWTVYFDDGTSKRIKVPSDEFDPYEYYKKQNKVVVNVDYSWDIQS